MAAHDWQEIVAQKRRAQAAAIAAYTSSAGEVRHPEVVDEPDATTLAAAMARGDVSAEDVAAAYIARCIEAHEKVPRGRERPGEARGGRDKADPPDQRLTASLTEILFDEAIVRARALDAHLATHGAPVGPLHGVPMTLKDQFDVRGHDTTLGYVGRAGAPAAESAVLVQMLEGLGAVVVAKTNLPQSIMWCETENPVFGLTTNPADAGYTPGGSTGGEAALLALGGSVVGWGTDIGGSIRIPAHMMGLYGLKPSSARLPYTGVAVSTEGQEHVPSSVGPLARSLESVRAVMERLAEAAPWTVDARCAPLPWRTPLYEAVGGRRLTIGVLRDDGMVRPHPPLTRVLDAAAARLRAAGHETVAWDARLHGDLVAVQDAFYGVDGGEDIRRDVARAGEPMLPHVAGLVARAGAGVSVYDYWQLNRRKWALQQAYLRQWHAAARDAPSGRPVDVLLLPPMPHVAVPHRSCRWVGYTKVWNVLDYPALVLPAGRVGPDDLDAPWHHAPRSDADAFNARLWDDHKADMARLALPVGLQIVARRLEEEHLLAAARVIEDVLRAPR